MSCDTNHVPSRVVSRPDEGRAVAAFIGTTATEPAALVAEGEPGIGKTTLCLSVIELAQERGFLVLSARPAEAESRGPDSTGPVGRSRTVDLGARTQRATT